MMSEVITVLLLAMTGAVLRDVRNRLRDLL